MKKLNTHKVHRVWQHGRDDQYNDGDDEVDIDPTIPKENVHDSAPQAPIYDHSEMIPQFWSGI